MLCIFWRNSMQSSTPNFCTRRVKNHMSTPNVATNKWMNSMTFSLLQSNPKLFLWECILLAIFIYIFWIHNAVIEDENSNFEWYLWKDEMKRTKIYSKQESATNRAVLTPTQFLKRNPIYRKANGEFIAKMFRLESERLSSTHPECKRSAHLLQQSFSATKKSTLINSSAKRLRKRRTLIQIMRSSNLN